MTLCKNNAGLGFGGMGIVDMFGDSGICAGGIEWLEIPRPGRGG